MPAARLDRANWHYRSPRWKHGIGRSALAAVRAQDRRRRDCPRFFPVYELLFTLRRTQGAIGRYEGTTGAAVAAAGRLRRLGRCRRRIPGAGKGFYRACSKTYYPPRWRRFSEGSGSDKVQGVAPLSFNLFGVNGVL